MTDSHDTKPQKQWTLPFPGEPSVEAQKIVDDLSNKLQTLLFLIGNKAKEPSAEEARKASKICYDLSLGFYDYSKLLP